MNEVVTFSSATRRDFEMGAITQNRRREGFTKKLFEKEIGEYTSTVFDNQKLCFLIWNFRVYVIYADSREIVTQAGGVFELT